MIVKYKALTSSSLTRLNNASKSSLVGLASTSNASYTSQGRRSVIFFASLILKGNFYSCDFVKIQDEKLVSPHSEWEYQLFELSPLSGNTNLPSVKNSFFRKFKGTYYHDSATIQAQYESLKNFPDLLLKQICDSLTELNLKYETPDENYPYIYNLKNIDTGVILPFIDLEYEDYRLVSLYQDE